MIDKPIAELVAGDIITALVWPDGHRRAVRGGPFEVAKLTPTGGQCDGMAQYEIVSTSRTRAARYANGATHVETAAKASH